ncbi:MAG: hypothetical protein ACXWGX_08215 [Usitatibacter sp.]
MSDKIQLAKFDELRHALLELHKSMLDAQRVRYQRDHGRIGSAGEFLGIVLEHPEFGWIRELSALIAQLDEWRDLSGEASGQDLGPITDALRKLIKAGEGTDFSRKYWEMAEANPDVLVGHVKLWRLLASPPNDKKP